MRPDPALARIEAELNYARLARRHGKEGRARVSARRAAGWAVAAYLRQQSAAPQRAAMDLLEWLEWNGPDELRGPAGRLRTPVTEDHQLPHPEDPLEDAERIVRGLLDDAEASGR